jgi:enoyl-CoA hydratase/carnithine racemase
MNDDILLDTSDGTVWTITLNRPQALNAITMAMAARLLQILADAATDEQARCLIITGAGTEAFSAGFDIKEMAEFDNDAMRDAFIQRDPLFKAIALHPLPIIAALNGKAFGAGALLAAAADFRIATRDTEFKVTAVNYGSANATWSLPRVIGLPRAKHILMTGRVVGTDEGLAIGLYDEVADDVVECALQLGGLISSKPATGVAAIKSLADASYASSLKAGWVAEHDHVLHQLSENGQAGNQVFSSFLKNRI